MPGDSVEQTEVVASAAGTSENTSAGTATIEAMASDAHAEDASEPTTTDGTASSEATASAATEEPIPADETPEQKNARRQRQREARKQAAAQAPPEPPAAAKTPAEIIAEHEAAQAAAREAQQKQEAERQKFAKRIGDDPADPNNPKGPTRYQQLLSEASIPIPDGDDQFYTEETRQLVARVNKAKQQLADLDERRALLNDVYTPAQQAAQLQARDWLGNELERGIAELGLNVPEVLASVQGIKDPNALIPQIVKTMGEKIKAAAVAPLNEKIEDLEDDLAAKDSEIDALRRQLGGAAPQALRGGSVAAGTTVYTRERLSQMLRTPEGIAEYRRNQAEISRQEAAGLIR